MSQTQGVAIMVTLVLVVTQVVYFVGNTIAVNLSSVSGTRTHKRLFLQCGQIQITLLASI